MTRFKANIPNIVRVNLKSYVKVMKWNKNENISPSSLAAASPSIPMNPSDLRKKWRGNTSFTTMETRKALNLSFERFKMTLSDLKNCVSTGWDFWKFHLQLLNQTFVCCSGKYLMHKIIYLILQLFLFTSQIFKIFLF